MERNNSVDYVRRRVESQNSIDNSRRSRENSVQRDTPKEVVREAPRPISRDRRELRLPSQELARRNSRDMKDVRPSSRDVKGEVRVSRERVNSRERSR